MPRREWRSRGRRGGAPRKVRCCVECARLLRRWRRGNAGADVATGRTRDGPGTWLSRAPKSGVGDAARGPRAAGGVGTAFGADAPAGEREMRERGTVGDELPCARLRGAGGVGLPRAPDGDPWVARVTSHSRCARDRLAAAGVGDGVGPSFSASPMRTPLPTGSTARRFVLLAVGSLLSSSSGLVPSTAPRSA